MAKYRDYSQEDDKGEYARIFEEEYEALKHEVLGQLPLNGDAHQQFLAALPVERTHNGYFSIDKKKRLVDPEIKKRGEEAGLSADVDAYDLILKDKESLLSYPTKMDSDLDRQKKEVRFIFSHSALREGWDNPNVFVMCMLKHSDNINSRRQEVGRGLRLAVNQQGERLDHPATVHDVNVLTVVASESYKDFVSTLQKEMVDSLSARPRKADEAYFTGKVIETETGKLEVTKNMAGDIEFYLIQNGYVDRERKIIEPYHAAKAEGTLRSLPDELKPHAEAVFKLIDSVFSEQQLPDIGDGRAPKKNPLNDNFSKKEFQALWGRINRKAVYQVDFDSAELVENAIQALNKELKVTPLQYNVQAGTQNQQISDDELSTGESFTLESNKTEKHNASIHSQVKYDLLGKIGEQTQLTRKTVGQILAGIRADTFEKFKMNPEHFMAECSRLIKEQKATMVIEQLSYNMLDDTHDQAIFTADNSKQDFANAGEKLKRHIYDYVVTDSNTERKFVAELDTSNEVVVYAKLPKGFYIPTPVGDYNPDWAIAFHEGVVKHIYFVAETKGSMSTLDLRGAEGARIDCARKFFKKVNDEIAQERVKYDVVASYEKLMSVVA